MKLPSGKRLGQSAQELALAAFFMFFIHAAVIVVALFLVFTAIPKQIIPPVYQVKLVGRLQELAPAPAPAPAPALPPQETVPEKVKPLPKLKKEAPKKSAMPEMKKARPEPEYVAEDAAEQPRLAEKKETVAGRQPSDFDKFPWYYENIKRKIRENWKPPVGVPKDTKATVVFRVLRSGWMEGVNLEAASNIYHYDRDAIRAVRSSSPFPKFPDDFPKQSAVFSVDLMPEE